MNQELKDQAREIMCANLIAFEENTPEDKKAELRPKVIFANLDSFIDKTAQHEQDRIVGLIEEIKSDIEDDGYGRGWNNSLNKLTSLITNKSELSTNKDEK